MFRLRTCYVSTATASHVLVEVVETGDVEVASVLIDAGAQVDYQSPTLNHQTALHRACDMGHLVWRLLLLSLFFFLSVLHYLNFVELRITRDDSCPICNKRQKEREKRKKKNHECFLDPIARPE